MERITFYWEWLMLPKAEFNILMMLADLCGSFSGNLADMCRYFRVSSQNKNKIPLRSAIEKLTADGLITSQKSGNNYTLQIIPKEREVKLLRRWVNPILEADNFSQSVAKAQVIKSLIWISQNSYLKELTVCILPSYRQFTRSVDAILVPSRSSIHRVFCSRKAAN